MSLNVCLGSLLVVVASCALLLRWAACALEVRALAGPAEGSGARGVRAALEIAAGAAGALAVAHGGSHPLTQGHPVVALVSTLDASLPCLHLAVLLVAQAVGALAGRLCVERLWATQFSFHHVIRHMLARAGECVVSPPPAVVVVPTATTTATAADGGHQALIEAMLTEAALSVVLALVVLRLGVPSSTSSAKAGGASTTTTTTTTSSGGDVGTTTSTTSSSSSRRSGGSGRVDVGPVSRTRALFIAACVATLSCIVESTSLGVFNPAVALALMWGCSTPSPSRLGLVYLLAPVLGALLAVFLYRGRVPLLFSRQLLYRTKPRPGPPPRPAQPAATAAPQLRARTQGAGKKAVTAAAAPAATPTGKAASLNAGKRGKAQ
uniref:Aquaporin-12A-like n=1 Tax=Petromyzon marinus TaxID=7757 RepID=A0AAJ7WXG9_PETMA|nr:aquaporin-12A-like [Petromyzon marinus]